uniref:T-box domain-containing protein n=1 Tax=Meloidogyne hapla TaxID=6305 RepID=A0A1I8B074_MELHA
MANNHQQSPQNNNFIIKDEKPSNPIKINGDLTNSSENIKMTNLQNVNVEMSNSQNVNILNNSTSSSANLPTKPMGDVQNFGPPNILQMAMNRPELFAQLFGSAAPGNFPSFGGRPPLWPLHTPLRFSPFDFASREIFGTTATIPSINHPPFPITKIDDGIKDNPVVQLEDKDLWEKFNPLVNEMIITKSGRWVKLVYFMGECVSQSLIKFQILMSCVFMF